MKDQGPPKGCFFLMDGGIGKNFDYKKFETSGYYSGELVLHV